MPPNTCLVDSHPRPRQPIRRGPHGRFPIAAGEVVAHANQPRRTRPPGRHHHHRLVPGTPEDGLVGRHPRPGQAIRRPPHRGIPIAAGVVLAGGHQPGPPDRHRCQSLITGTAEHHFVWRHPSPVPHPGDLGGAGGDRNRGGRARRDGGRGHRRRGGRRRRGGAAAATTGCQQQHERRDDPRTPHPRPPFSPAPTLRPGAARRSPAGRGDGRPGSRADPGRGRPS